MTSMRTVILAGAMVCMAGAANAADPTPEQYQAMGFYLRADAGLSFLEWSGGDDDHGFAAGVGAGMQITDNLRGDLRLDYGGEYDAAPADNLSVTTVLGNLYFDIPTETAFVPYLGAGAGYGWTSADAGGDDNGFAFGLMAGVGIDLTEQLVLDVGYRYRDVMISGDDPSEHQLTGGLRLEF